MNLRDVNIVWINLDEATENAKRMEDLFSRLGLTKTHRLSALKKPSPPGTAPSEIHYVGVGESHIKALEYIRDKLPAVIFEDDVEITDWFPENGDIPEIPAGADAVYMGTSHGDNNYEAKDIGGGYARIKRMLAAHAIMYMTPAYVDAVKEIAKVAMYEWKRPFDLGTYSIIENFNVITPHAPWFYQKAAPDALNDWESITKTPLKIIRKGSMISTIGSDGGVVAFEKGTNC
jgi:hypothetical protein